KGVRVGQPPVACSIAGVVAQRLVLADGKSALEEARRAAAGKLACLPASERESGDEFRIRDEATSEEPLSCLLDTQNREGVAMRAGNDRLDIASRRRTFAGSVSSGSRVIRQLAPLLDAGAVMRRFMQSHHAGTFQISLAYSRMVRSDENHPIWATLRMARAYQSQRSRHISSTVRCAAA